MGSIVWLIGIGLLAAESRAQPGGTGLKLSAMLATDYKTHSLSQTDNGAAARVSVDYARDSGWFAGGAVGNVEYAIEASRRRRREIRADVYAGYQWRGRAWSASAAVARYIYPDIEFRYDYSQAEFGVGFRERWFLNAGYTNNLLSLERTAYHYDIGVWQPWIWDLEFSAGLGRFRAAEFFGVDFTYWNVGLSKPIDRFALDLRFSDSSQDRLSLLGDPKGDRWTLSVSYAIAPREP